MRTRTDPLLAMYRAKARNARLEDTWGIRVGMSFQRYVVIRFYRKNRDGYHYRRYLVERIGIFGQRLPKSKQPEELWGSLYNNRQLAMEAIRQYERRQQHERRYRKAIRLRNLFRRG